MDKIKTTILGFFNEQSKNSMIRLGMFITMLTACFSIILITIGTYKAIIAYKISGLDISLIITSIAGFAGVFIYGKVQQKKIETATTNTIDSTTNTVVEETNK